MVSLQPPLVESSRKLGLKLGREAAGEEEVRTKASPEEDLVYHCDS
jgi:hypothetical protein